MVSRELAESLEKIQEKVGLPRIEYEGGISTKYKAYPKMNGFCQKFFVILQKMVI